MRTRPLALIAVSLVLSGHYAEAGTHPRLVFGRGHVSRIRAAELAEPRLTRLQTRLSGDLGDVTLPGEVLAAAAVQLFAPGGAADRGRLDLIERNLATPPVLGPDLLECAVALDWCWDDLGVTSKQVFLERVLEEPLLLSEQDSPLEHEPFRRKLAHLAVALAVDDADFREPTWGEVRTRIIRAARGYMLTALPNYLAWRGGVPTSSARGPWEESNTAWLIELGSLAVGKNLWQEHATEIGRWLEHYVVIQDETRPQGRRLVRDDGDAGHTHPAAHATSLLPMTAHLWAARTGNPAAVGLARQLEPALRREAIETALWSWLDVALPLDGFPAADLAGLPAQRNLDGAVVMRPATGGRSFVVWIDTGGAYLRRGQHFDAGHFLIEGDGPLLTDAGAEVALEAVSTKDGEQRLGDGRATFPFEQFAAATIAHNAMLFDDPARLYQWYQRPFVPRGGQRPIEGSCADLRTPLEAQKRGVGRLTAYGFSEGVSYAAMDLAAAYDSRTVKRYTRAFLLLWGKVLLVIDVAQTSGANVTPVWVAQLPAAPDERLLDPQLQVRGEDEAAGIWRVPGGDWVRSTSRAGTIALRGLLPAERVVSLVGGTGERSRIRDGAFAGRSYVGGSAETFERLVAPTGHENAGNAWFRLGAPTRLGPDFGGQSQQLWGRMEIAGRGRVDPQMFVTAIVLEPADQPLSQVRITEEAGGVLLFLRDGERAATVQLQMRDTLRGFVVVDPGRPAWELPQGVMEDPPLPAK